MHLKKLRRVEGSTKNVLVFRVKNHNFTPKNHIIHLGYKFIIKYISTVKPVYKGHRSGPENVHFTGCCLLYTGSDYIIYTLLINGENEAVLYTGQSGGKYEKCFGISCEKSQFYAKKSYFFPIAEVGTKFVRVFRVKNYDFTPKNHQMSRSFKSDTMFLQSQNRIHLNFKNKNFLSHIPESGAEKKIRSKNCCLKSTFGKTTIHLGYKYFLH
jgi:hypothetical protein